MRRNPPTAAKKYIAPAVVAAHRTAPIRTSMSTSPTCTCAVPAASVVGEAMVSFVLADAICTQFHADTMIDLAASLAAYRARLERVWQKG